MTTHIVEHEDYIDIIYESKDKLLYAYHLLKDDIFYIMHCKQNLSILRKLLESKMIVEMEFIIHFFISDPVNYHITLTRDNQIPLENENEPELLKEDPVITKIGELGTIIKEINIQNLRFFAEINEKLDKKIEEMDRKIVKLEEKIQINSELLIHHQLKVCDKFQELKTDAIVSRRKMEELAINSDNISSHCKDILVSANILQQKTNVLDNSYWLNPTGFDYLGLNDKISKESRESLSCSYSLFLLSYKFVDNASRKKIVKIRNGKTQESKIFYAKAEQKYKGFLFDINDEPFENWINDDTAYIEEWYDQSGNFRHATQKIYSLQPILNYQKKCIFFEDNKFLEIPASTVPSFLSDQTIQIGFGNVKSESCPILGGDEVKDIERSSEDDSQWSKVVSEYNKNISKNTFIMLDGQSAIMRNCARNSRNQNIRCDFAMNFENSNIFVSRKGNYIYFRNSKIKTPKIFKLEKQPLSLSSNACYLGRLKSCDSDKDFYLEGEIRNFSCFNMSIPEIDEIILTHE